MKNYWLEQAEKKEMIDQMSTEQMIERIQSLLKSLMPRKNKIRDTKDLFLTKNGHTFEMRDEFCPVTTLTDEGICSFTVNYDMNMKEFQEEVERIEAEGWVLDL